VTAFLAFVPKTSGFVAIIKILIAVGGSDWRVPPEVVTLLVVIAALTMTVGNMLGLLQHNVKRVLAYSSIAHSGYMLVGVTALIAASTSIPTTAKDFAQWDVIHGVQAEALQGVLFYLAAYGIMNAGAFGVMMLLPARKRANDFGVDTSSAPFPPPATSAETFDDLAGQGRHHVGLGLAMAVSCFSLIGIPLTAGFTGKFFVFRAAWDTAGPLVVIALICSAIAAFFYLRIVVLMYFAEPPENAPTIAIPGWSTTIALTFGVIVTIALGVFPQPIIDLAGKAAHFTT